MRRKHPEKRTRGGVQANPISADDILQATLAEAREHGLAAITVRSVAQRLGVTGPAIYYHVPGGRDALVQLVADHVAEQVYREALFEAPGDTGIDTLVKLIIVSARAEREYPGMVAYTMSSGQNRPLALEGSEFGVRQLLRSGFSPKAAAQAYAAIHAFMTGWALIQWPSPTSAHQEERHVLAAVVDTLHDVEPEALLRSNLEAILDGLHRALAEPVTAKV